MMFCNLYQYVMTLPCGTMVNSMVAKLKQCMLWVFDVYTFGVPWHDRSYCLNTLLLKEVFKVAKPKMVILAIFNGEDTSNGCTSLMKCVHIAMHVTVHPAINK